MPSAQIHRLTTAAALFALLIIAVAIARPDGAWGIDALAYHPTSSALLFGLAAALLLSHAFRDAIIRGLSKLPFDADPWQSRRSAALLAAALCAVGLALFVHFRASVHLLGDGWLYTKELNQNTWAIQPRMDRAPLTFAIVRLLHAAGTRSEIWATGQATYQVLSTLSGLAFIALSVTAARLLGQTALQRWTVLGICLTQGFVQVFFGYVENYAPVSALVLGYLVVALMAARGQVSIWIPALALGAIIPMHVSLAALLPSLILLGFLESRTEPASPPTPAVLKTLLLPACSLAFCLAIMLAIGYDPLILASEGHLLPFTGGPTSTAAYSFFSGSHLLDAANCLLLMAPGAVIILVGLRRKSSSPRSMASADRMLLSASAGFPLVLAGMANFEIGAFRDWDVFTFAAAPLALRAGKALIEVFDDPPPLAHAAILVCGISALSTVAWIGVNARPRLAVERFERNLESEALSTHARGYGWETLGSVRLHEGSLATALNALLAAVEANPGNPRYWSNAGCLMLKLGRPEEAVDFYRRGLSGTSPVALDADCLFNLGYAYNLLNRHGEAIAAYGKAIRKNASFALAYSNMGKTFAELGEYENALQCYGSVLRIDPNLPQVQQNIQTILSRIANPEQTWNRIRKLLDLT